MNSINEQCPSCHTTLPLQIDFEVGDALECGQCRKELQVIWPDPVTLAESGDDEEYILDSYYPNIH